MLKCPNESKTQRYLNGIPSMCTYKFFELAFGTSSRSIPTKCIPSFASSACHGSPPTAPLRYSDSTRRAVTVSTCVYGVTAAHRGTSLWRCCTSRFAASWASSSASELSEAKRFGSVHFSHISLNKSFTFSPHVPFHFRKPQTERDVDSRLILYSEATAMLSWIPAIVSATPQMNTTSYRV